jgi:hypothetical protein
MKRQQMIGLRLMVLGSSLPTLTARLLSPAGIYAMMSFTVSQRRKEIGIRAARLRPFATISYGVVVASHASTRCQVKGDCSSKMSPERRWICANARRRQ